MRTAYERYRERATAKLVQAAAGLRVDDALEALADYYRRRAAEAAAEGKRFRKRDPEHVAFVRCHRYAADGLDSLVALVRT